MYINGNDNKADVIQNVIENIDDGLLSNAKDMLSQLKEVELNSDKSKYIGKIVYEDSDIDIALNLEAEEKRGK